MCHVFQVGLERTFETMSFVTTHLAFFWILTEHRTTLLYSKVWKCVNVSCKEKNSRSQELLNALHQSEVSYYSWEFFFSRKGSKDETDNTGEGPAL